METGTVEMMLKGWRRVKQQPPPMGKKKAAE
jgi:hypothetical protein